MAQPPPLRPGDIEHVFHYGPLGNRYRVEVLVYGHDEITFDSSEPVIMPASITPYLPQLTQVQRGEAMRAYTLMIYSREAIDTLTKAQYYLTNNGLVAAVQEAARTLRTVNSSRPPSCKDFNSLRQLEPKARSDLVALLIPLFETKGVVVRCQALDTILNDLSALNTHWMVYLSTDTEVLVWASNDKVLKFSRWVYANGTLNYPPQPTALPVPANTPAVAPAPATAPVLVPTTKPPPAPTPFVPGPAVHQPAPAQGQSTPVSRAAIHPQPARNPQAAPGLLPTTNRQQPALPHMAPASSPAGTGNPGIARAWDRGESLEGYQNPGASITADRARKKARRDQPEQ